MRFKGPSSLKDTCCSPEDLNSVPNTHIKCSQPPVTAAEFAGTYICMTSADTEKMHIHDMHVHTHTHTHTTFKKENTLFMSMNGNNPSILLDFCFFLYPIVESLSVSYI